ncbi:MAG: glycerophosphodiester phosphodiesterase [Lachnospiraceae bacterium]|nr:glycerophosphodiester phosphodiesterase [Lachnospiraceae bacterium]
MKTKVWAHRGASAYAPENTMEAFELAWKQKADGIELDVQMTRDGKLVVIHDETIDRTSDGTGYVKDYTLEKLREFSFNRLHPQYIRAGIPTLEEVFDFLKETDMTVNVELKNSIIPYPLLEEKVLAMAERMGLENRVIYSSFNHKSVVKIKKMSPKSETGILYSDGWLRVPAYGKRLEADALHPALYHVKGTKLIQKSHEKGLKVHVWTVNQREDMEFLVRQQADAIITNCPDLCRSVADAVGKIIPEPRDKKAGK